MTITVGFLVFPGIQLQRCEIMVLDAYVTNQAARRFYERNGYQIVGHHFVTTL